MRLAEGKDEDKDSATLTELTTGWWGNARDGQGVCPRSLVKV